MLGDSWRELLPLVPLLPRDAQVQVWSEVLAEADGMPVEQLRSLAAGALDLGVDDMLPDVVSVARTEDLWTPVLRLLVVLGPDLHRRLEPLASRLPADQRAEARVHAERLGVLEGLGVLGEALDGAGPWK